MQAALQTGLRSPIGKQVTTFLISEIAFPLAQAGVKKGAPIIANGMKKGASAVKSCGKEAYKSMNMRYGNPGKSFTVTEKPNGKDGSRFISVSKDTGAEFLKTWYPV